MNREDFTKPNEIKIAMPILRLPSEKSGKMMKLVCRNLVPLQGGKGSL